VNIKESVVEPELNVIGKLELWDFDEEYITLTETFLCPHKLR